ncbi:MAG TPA: gfo/Idh/MocA family oxidoreductase [Armatimonadetes bacterium]|nr:gfo/Idh/MocA family oxidoreductase [Armatimonadota bacterium]
MANLRYGIVGAGSIGKVHAEAISKVDGAEVVAFADPAMDTRQAAAERFGVPLQYDYVEDMLAAQKLDVVVVAVPNVSHAPVALAALRAGCHVLCEKPPTVNAAQAKEMMDLAADKGVRLQYGLVMRFSAEAETAKAYVDAGRLGTIYHSTVQIWRRRGIPGLGSWFTTKAESGGGALIDIGVHMIDLTHYLMGLPKPIAASAVTHAKFGVDADSYNYLSMWGTPVPGGPFDVDDLACALIRFENGASLVLQAAWAANTSDGMDVRLMGDKGGLELSPGNYVRVLTEDNGFIADIKPQYKAADNFAEQHRHLVAAIGDKSRAIRTDGRQGFVLQSMLDAIYRSAAEGNEVKIEV